MDASEPSSIFARRLRPSSVPCRASSSTAVSAESGFFMSWTSIAVSRSGGLRPAARGGAARGPGPRAAGFRRGARREWRARAGRPRARRRRARRRGTRAARATTSRGRRRPPLTMDRDSRDFCAERLERAESEGRRNELRPVGDDVGLAGGHERGMARFGSGRSYPTRDEFALPSRQSMKTVHDASSLRNQIFDQSRELGARGPAPDRANRATRGRWTRESRPYASLRASLPRTRPRAAGGAEDGEAVRAASRGAALRRARACRAGIRRTS